MNRRQTIPKHLRYTIEDFNRQFPNDEACFEHLREMRFPDGMAYCEKCKSEQKHHRVKGRPVYACDVCLTQISPMAGTIFEHSSTSLRLWYYAMYLMSSTRCGISAKQIQRETGVTYKTAWRMFRQIRSLMSEPDMQLEGEAVEMDETYYGGTRKYSAGRKMRGDTKKTPIVGMAERKGRVMALVAPDIKGSTLLGYVRDYVVPKTLIFTDEAITYDGITHMPEKGYRHRRIKHSSRVYVKGNVHTNTIEGFWSLVKRGIGGVYHQVSEKYLQTYLNEYSFRYNRREKGNLIFNDVLKLVSEKAS
ncbi:MAG TPA: IS1595 family transposase [Terriglobales bacterium]|nr:IS1595 family transposase [Terriglobales bacterium]